MFPADLIDDRVGKITARMEIALASRCAGARSRLLVLSLNRSRTGKLPHFPVHIFDSYKY